MMASELVPALTRYTSAFPGQTAITTATPSGVIAILRADRKGRPKHPSRFTWKPALCFVAQGAKAAVFGDKKVYYGAGQALVVSIEIPAAGWVVDASPKAPFLGVALELDLAILREVYEQLDERPPATERPRRSVLVTDFDGPLSDCIVRIVRLLSTPRAIGVVYPAITREICYWLLAGPHGAEIAAMTLASGHAEPIVRAIVALRERFDKPVRIDELASIAHLSASAFHRQFKALTSMTPLQYQKQVRLLEARRLMVAESASAATAGFKVGYESPSQFSREYARMFGHPPRRDAVSLLR